MANKVANTFRKVRSDRERGLRSLLLGRTLTGEEIERAALVSVDDLSCGRFPKMIAALKRWGASKTLDIVKLKPARVLAIRGVGARKLSALKAAVDAAISGAPAHSDNSKTSIEVKRRGESFSPILGRKLSEEERALLDGVSAEAAIEDVRARNTFKALGIKTALSAARLAPETFISVPNAGRRTLAKVAAAIERTISELRTQPPNIDLTPRRVIAFVNERLLIRLPERERMVLRDRYGLWDGVEETLEDIGGKLGLTRERVRQIQAKAENRIRGMAIPRRQALWLVEKFREASHAAVLEKYEGLASLQELEKSVFDLDGDVQTIDIAYDFLKRVYFPGENPLAEGLESCGEETIAVSAEVKERFERTVDAAKLALVAKGRPRSPEELVPLVSSRIQQSVLPSFLRRCAEVSDEIGFDGAGRIGLRRWHHFNPRTIDQMARSTLLDLGQPSHYSHIVSKMNALFPQRAPFNAGSVTNCMTSRPDIFVSLRRGMFALTDWGIKPPPLIRDFLVGELLSSPRPLSVNELVSRGTSKYGYREASLRMTLSFNRNLFRELPGGVYELDKSISRHVSKTVSAG